MIIWRPDFYVFEGEFAVGSGRSGWMLDPEQLSAAATTGATTNQKKRTEKNFVRFVSLSGFLLLIYFGANVLSLRRKLFLWLCSTVLYWKLWISFLLAKFRTFEINKNTSFSVFGERTRLLPHTFQSDFFSSPPNDSVYVSIGYVIEPY